MERGFTEGGREGGRVIESFAFLENIIDRLELIGAETIGRRSSLSLVCFRSNSRCGRAVEKPLIGGIRRAERIRPGIYSHNNVRVIAVLDLKCMHPRRMVRPATRFR